MDSKLCRKCNTIKFLSEFNIQPKTKDGRKTVCKSCCNHYYRRIPEAKRAENWVRPTEGTKYCPTCKLVLHVIEFSSDRKRADGLHSKCNKCNNAERKENRKKLRFEVLSNYSGGKPKCFCCGENHIEFLWIEHLDGNGADQKRSIGLHGKSSEQFQRWLKKNNYPEGFGVLCANCNSSRGFYGYCPHQKLKEEND